MSLYRRVSVGASALGALREIHRRGKNLGVHRMTLLSQTYEKPTWRRNRISEERAYYPKWHFLNYAYRVVSYALKNHLLFPAPFDADDEQRLTSLRDKGFFTPEEAASALPALSAEVAATEQAIRSLDELNPVSLQPRTVGALNIPASQVLQEIADRGGVVPPYRHLKRRLAVAGWSAEETACLHHLLTHWVSLLLRRQKLEEVIEAHEGKGASWTKGFSFKELQDISLKHAESEKQRRNETRNPRLDSRV